MTNSRSPHLSTAEINALIPGSVDAETPAAVGATEANLSPAVETKLREIFGAFAAQATAHLAKPLRGDTQLSFVGLREISSSELLARMERPTCILIAQLAPFAERVLIELPYGSFFPLLDRLLGGGQHPCPTMRRPLTRIERRLAARLASYLLAAFVEAWQPHVECTPMLQAIECDPRVLPWSDADERLIMAQCDVRVPIHRGGCCISFRRHDLLKFGRSLRLGPYAKLVERALPKLPGKRSEQLTAVIGHAAADAKTVENSALELGQVLWTDAAPDDAVLVYQGAQLRYVAEKGLQDGQKAIRILRHVDDEPPAVAKSA